MLLRELSSWPRFLRLISVCTVGVVIFSSSEISFGQSLPPGVSQGMLDQLKAMPSAQRQALASKYGISLEGAAEGPIQVSGLGGRGENVESVSDSDVGQSIAPRETVEPPEEVSEAASQRYGRDLFQQSVSTFAPTDNAPVPSDYRLGVGDQLLVQLYGKEFEQFVLQIGRSGEVALPNLGPLTLSGVTFEYARELIENRVEKQLIGVDVVVNMGRLRAINIFMSGEVAVPGAYSVSALTTVTQALFQAGGVSDIGSLRDIQIIRSGETVASFDSYALLMKGDASKDIRLQSGDVIFVPPYQGVVDVKGELKRPMVYEVLGSESLGDIVEMAGSFTRNAFPNAAVITRESDTLPLPEAITIDLTLPDSREMKVRAGDSIMVPKRGEVVANSVTLRGAVTRPGIYGWHKDLRLSSLIKDARSDLLRDADLSFGLIVRQKNELLDITVSSFDLTAVLESPGSDNDPLLNEFDEILVFSVAEEDIKGAENSLEGRTEEGMTDAENSFRLNLLAPVIKKLGSQARHGQPQQIVSISGAVNAPGTYPLVAGATAKTLVNMAGGLSDSAYVDRVELRRLNEVGNGRVEANYTELDLSQGAEGYDVLMSSRDHLTIRKIADWSPSDSVVIEGEVTFPGEYRIRPSETLSSILSRAGGLTENAFANAAVLTRESIAELEAKRAADFAQNLQASFAARMLTEETNQVGIDEVSQIVLLLQAVEGAGRLIIDLEGALAGDEESDIVVMDGDRVIIPTISNTVSVVGEVQRSQTHTYQNALSVDDYLELSAGLTQRADTDGIYIVRANGSVVTFDRSLWEFSSQNSELYPGDTIVVPIDTQYKARIASWREITSLIYESVVSVAALASL